MNKKVLVSVGIVIIAIVIFKISSTTNKSEFKYFGNEAKGDLNGDGLEDKAYLVMKQSGGSTSYYAQVDLKTATGYKTTNPFFIGTDIAPQSTYIPKNSQEIQVAYAERKSGAPSVGAVKLLKVNSSGILEGLMK
ncbi:hypothetical protein KW807_01590 [Candidatus Parcubacteria bacterium]|nr:hypothetical protein [Candidatus Parcubacteria bacterium]